MGFLYGVVGKKMFFCDKMLEANMELYFTFFFLSVVSIWTEVIEANNDTASPKVDLEKVNDDEGQAGRRLTTKLTCLYPFSYIIHCNHRNWSSLPTPTLDGLLWNVRHQSCSKKKGQKVHKKTQNFFSL